MARTPRRRTSTVPDAAAATAGSAEPRRVRENLARPAAAPVAAGVARPQPSERRRSPFAFFGKLTPRFAGDIISELRKVTWPTFAETRDLTMVVAIVAVAVGLLLGGVDLVFGWVVEKLFFT